MRKEFTISSTRCEKEIENDQPLDHKIIVCKDFESVRNPRSLLKSFERGESFRGYKKMQKGL